MLIGLISDTHDRLERTRRAIDLLIDAGCDVLIHCGDVTQPDVLAVCAARPLYFVLGNNDAATELQCAARKFGATCLGWGGEITLAGQRIAVTHGHRVGEMRRLLAARPDYLFCGHSHLAREWRIGDVPVINPGALHRARECTVAILDLDTAAVRFLPISR